ncbi:unnamed protein product [Caenorhabditis nigoni]
MMKFLCLLALIAVCHIDAKGLLDHKSDTLKTFNDARRLLASGSLKPLIDIANGILDKLELSKAFKLPEFGPAANMHRLRWSPKLENVAYVYGKGRHSLEFKGFKSFEYNGLAGFEWKGSIIEIALKLIEFIPVDKIKMVLKPLLNILDRFLTALLLLWNYPGTLPLNPINANLGATEALFAHRYEVGCYAKLMYSVCFMDPDRNNGYLYETGVPCSNCITHCEFFEKENGIIEEGDLCEAPREESNSTSELVIKKESLEEMENGHGCKMNWNMIAVLSGLLFPMIVVDIFI